MIIEMVISADHLLEWVVEKVARMYDEYFAEMEPVIENAISSGRQVLS